MALESLKALLGLKKKGVSNRTYTQKPVSDGYRSFSHIYWMQPRDLPPFNYVTIYNMLIDPEVRLALAVRCAPLFGAEWGYKEGDQWMPGIMSDRPEVAAFVERQLKKIWWNHLPDICKSQIWGWSAGEVVLKLSAQNLIEVDRLEPRLAEDARLILHKGAPAGVQIQRIEKKGKVWLEFPNAFFHSHNPDPGNHYGISQLIGAYNAWADKWLDGGALDVRRLFMHKDAYGGVTMGYPEGETYIDGQTEPVPNRDIARQIAEQIRAGNTIVRPSKRDENGNDAWPIERANVPANPQHILQYPKDLDAEIRTGIGVPDGIIDSDSGSGGGWAGKRIPMQAFYASLDTWIIQIINDLTDQIFKPLVKMNFGSAIEFEIKHKPLAEQAMEQQSNAGPGMDDGGMGGMMGEGMPGMEADPAAEGSGLGGMDFSGFGGGPEAQLLSLVGQGVMTGDQAIRMRATWDESKHKRDSDGKFAKQNGEKKKNSVDEFEALSGSDRQRAVAALADQGNTRPTGFIQRQQWMADVVEWHNENAAQDRTEEPETADSETGPRAARPNGTPENPENKNVYTIPPTALEVDAARFQYKVKGIGDKGVGQELKGTAKWNPDLGGVLLVWRDPENGKDYVVNGHHRHELATRAGAKEINVRYIDEENAKMARSRGALANIAEGRGSAIDAAKYLRDTGQGLDHLRDAGISLSGKIASDAGVLVDLAQRPFDMVAQGVLEESTAVAVAKHLKDHDLQNKLFERIDDREENGKHWSIRETEQAAKKMANAGKVTTSGTDLFGDWEEEDDTFDQEVELEAYISRNLVQNANDYRAVASNRRAERVADAGNVLATEENDRRAKHARGLADTFEREVNLKGTVADLIKKHAADLANAKTRQERRDIKKKALDDLTEKWAVRMSLGICPEFVRLGQMMLWDETQHPRDADGKFVKKGTGEAPKAQRNYDDVFSIPTKLRHDAVAQLHERNSEKGGSRWYRPTHDEILDTVAEIEQAKSAQDQLEKAPEAEQPPEPAKPKPEKIDHSKGNWRYKSDDQIFSRGKKTKFRDNIAAIKLMRQLEIEERDPTDEEKAVIAKYVGWGQMPELFSHRYRGDWANEQEELRDLVGQAAYNSARRSTQNSHYTDPHVVRAHWDMAQRMGFKGGKYLEPAVGSGYYLGMMPEQLAKDTAVTAIELDELTGGIAKNLYPSANVHITGFEERPTPDNFYDLVATNVPFSDVRMHDPKYGAHQAMLHDYYFMRSIDTAKPGALVMHITSHGTMDKMDERVRSKLEEQADFVSAIRFPSGTHSEGAGTEVVTDMIILRKKHPAIPEVTDETPDDAKPATEGFTGITRDSLGRLYHWRNGKRIPKPSWEKAVMVPDPGGGDDIRVNEYFADNPEQVLGVLDRSGSMRHGAEKGVTKTDDYDQLLQAAIERLPENINWADVDTGTKFERVEAYEGEYNEGQLVDQDGELFRYESGSLVRVDKGSARLMAMLGIRDAGRALLADQREGNDPTANREKLNELYDDFVKEYGAIHTRTNRNQMKGDSDLTFLLSLEQYDSKTRKAEKAPIFTVNTIEPESRAENADNVTDAVYISLNETGGIDADRISELLGRDIEEVGQELAEAGLAFHNPNGKWEHAATYLSGNTRNKLKEAIAAAELDDRYNVNVEALQAHQPTKIEYEDIGVKINSPWVPSHIVSQFARETVNIRQDDKLQVEFIPETGHWLAKIDNRYRSHGRNVWSVQDDSGATVVDFQRILQHALSGKSIVVRSAFTGDDQKIVLGEATALANDKVEQLREMFKEWVWADPQRREFLVEHYNDTQNQMVEIKFDGRHLDLPGLRTNGWPLRDVQKDAVARIVATGKGLLAHEVGLGKTAAMVASTMELRRLKLANKPAISVLKSNIEQITAEAQELYPDAKILSLAGNFTAEKRQETLNRIATGDYDMIVLTHDNLNMMQLRPETQAKFLREEIQELEDAVLAVATGDPKMDDRIVKRLENMKDKLTQKLRKAMDGGNKDDIYFEDLGIDHLVVDEAHEFKSLPCVSAKGQIKGIPSGRSERATNMLAKTRWLLANNEGRGVVFATGTPIANTMGELYNMQRYLQYDMLKERGLHRFDTWADTYGELITAPEIKLDGSIKDDTRFTSFVNLDELRYLASDFMDIQRVDGLPPNPDGSPQIKRPKKRDQLISAPIRPEIADFMKSIEDRAESLKGQRPEPGADNMLNVCNDARLGSIDMRLVDPKAADHPDSKANRAVAEIVRIYKENPGKTQAVFSDLGIHATEKTGFSLFDDMIDKLVEAGIPRDEIINFSDQSIKNAKREEAQSRMKSGDARIAFGSTKRLGTGVNIQKQLRAIHHLDIPWLPAPLEQRNGRGFRTGNKNDEIGIYKYVQEGSADNLFWQYVGRKSHFINQYMLGKNNRSMEELDDTLTPEEMVAAASGDSAIMERMTLKSEIKKLERSASRHTAEQTRLKTQVEKAPQIRKELESKLAQVKQDAEHIAEREDFTMQFSFEDDHFATERKDAVEHLNRAIKAVRQKHNRQYWNRRPVEVGTYKSMPIYITGDGRIELQGPSGRTYKAADNLKSLEYVARNIGKKTLDRANEEIQKFEDEIKQSREAGERPFGKIKELEEKKKRLQYLEENR